MSGKARIGEDELLARLERMAPPRPAPPDSLYAALAGLPALAPARKRGWRSTSWWPRRVVAAGFVGAVVVVAIAGGLLLSGIGPLTVAASPSATPTAGATLVTASSSASNDAPSSTPSVTASGSAQSMPTASATAAATPTTEIARLPAFDTPGADVGAGWKSLEMTSLPAGSPLRTVSSVIRWRGGYVARGQGLWTSSDGQHWTPLDQALPVKAALIAETHDGLVALAYDPATCPASSDQCSQTTGPFAFTAWTSGDGRTWTNRGPASGIGQQRLYSIVGGPLGAFAAVGDAGGPAHVIRSGDGISWVATDAAGQLGVSCGSALGYGVGKVVTFCLRPADESGDRQIVARWSSDGVTWQTGTAAVASGRPALMTTIVAGRGGFIATGWLPGDRQVEQWWTSSDGETWTRDDTFAPVGPLSASDASWGPRACGNVASDGDRFVAMGCSAGPAPSGGVGNYYTSWDGRTWTEAIHCGGDACWGTGQMPSFVVFPRGILVLDRWAAGSTVTPPGG